MITRKEYMESKGLLFHAYYLQFATAETRHLVINAVGKDRILESTDEYFNDIPLVIWDNIKLKATIDQRLKGQAEDFEVGRFGWSMSENVCISKAVAREYKIKLENM